MPYLLAGLRLIKSMNSIFDLQHWQALQALPGVAAAAMKTINGHGAKFGDACALGIVAIKLFQA